jgi:hypothetical protein
MGGVIFSVNGRLKYLELGRLLYDQESSRNDANDNEEANGDGVSAHTYTMARQALQSLPARNMDIRDRNKGDVLTKGLTFLQTLWFIVQLAARRAQNLNVTALEVVTLAYAVTTIFAYIFWKDKPLDVQNPIVIPLSTPPVEAIDSSPNQSEGQGILTETPSPHPGSYLPSCPTS